MILRMVNLLNFVLEGLIFINAQWKSYEKLINSIGKDFWRLPRNAVNYKNLVIWGYSN